STSNSTITTDAEGVMRLVLDDELGGDALRKLHLRRRQESRDVQSVALELPRPLRAGEDDPGVVRLAPPPLVCAGVVVGSNGDRAGGANARVDGRVRAGRGDGWRPEHELDAVTAADGSFQIRGVAEAGELRASAAAKGYLPLDSAPFAAGTAGLRLQ